MKDFFISYTRIDRSWAEWVAWQLEENGYSVVIQAWDFRPGNNFVIEMQKAAAEADRTIPILSSDYLAARFTLPEWSAAFAQDPTGEQGKLVPVKVAECNPQGLLPQLIYIDLVGKAEQAARETLLTGVKKGRNKPAQPPGFPAVRPPRKEGTEQPNFPQASGMPELERHVELFRAADILEAIPDLADDIVGRIKLASSGAVLLDNSTIEYAFEALSGGPSDFASKVLPSKKWVIANSVVELIDALVLHETVIAGPAGQEAWYAREDLKAASKLIQRPDQQIGDKALFGLLSLARTRSMDAIRADQELVCSLNRLLEHQLDSELVRRYIGGLSLNASYHSPHYWERLFSKGKAEYYFEDLSSGVLGANTIAMNAVDDENAGRGNWSNDYLGYIAKRKGVEFPERESIHEFYAASLV